MNITEIRKISSAAVRAAKLQSEIGEIYYQIGADLVKTTGLDGLVVKTMDHEICVYKKNGDDFPTARLTDVLDFLNEHRKITEEDFLSLAITDGKEFKNEAL